MDFFKSPGGLYTTTPGVVCCILLKENQDNKYYHIANENPLALIISSSLSFIPIFFHLFYILSDRVVNTTTMSKLFDVIIAGGGPVGLFLACELRLAQASVLVLERDLVPESPWKALPLGRRTMHTVSMEIFQRRGLLSKFVDVEERLASLQKTTGFKHGGNFAGIMLNGNKLDLSRWKYHPPGPTLGPAGGVVEQVEKVLAERAESLGATILRAHEVEKFFQHGDSVTVEAAGEKFQGRWLIGCDGGRSMIRNAAGFGFVGTEAKFTGYAVQCDFDHPEKLKPGFQVTKTGMYIVAPGGSLYLVDFDGGAFDRTQEITKEHIQDVFIRASGITDVNITKIHLATSFTDRTKQATSYRKGRVILAGDAAHIHSAVGSQGLNLGLGDAMNLGWKLGATIRRESAAATASDMPPSDLSLLDTYETERHPIGAAVLDFTRAQVSLMQPDMHNVHALVREMANTSDGASVLMEHVWGISQRYNYGDTGAKVHPLVGCSAPDFELNDGSWLGPKMSEGRGLLVSFEEDALLENLITGGKHEALVDYLVTDVKDKLGIRALLIRPDGYVAWVAGENETADINSARVALENWFSF
ncbi:putative pentachlorophenol 4-monooxygenase [Mariannaea sp. PMI_226]|nr:putative pentachlorophenol 4-monooxygenase [Mariannaea sp. PMI_226]